MPRLADTIQLTDVRWRILILTLATFAALC
jgi:hypothetical protein